MDSADDLIARLASSESFGYHHGSEWAAEPAALSALALLAAGRVNAAAPLLEWLAARQSNDGMVGIDQLNAAPGWPTAWATIAWRQAALSELADERFASPARRGIAWLLSVQGELIPRTATTGHDTMIKGWPWVQGTHAWAEPTAMSLLALRHAGLGSHPRARDAARLLQDRMLPHGGCNYGNTIVFGQELRPQMQPTGLCLLALAGQRDPNGRTAKSIDYLRRELSAQTSTASMCYAVLGLAAHDQLPGNARLWLDAAARRTLARDPGAYKLALLTLAQLGADCPLVPSMSESILP